MRFINMTDHVGLLKFFLWNFVFWYNVIINGMVYTKMWSENQVKISCWLLYEASI